jgi:7-cyano-7-deazaguanine synthase
MKSIVLLSGGIDSATILAACVADGDECVAIGFDYDQPHRIELSYARDIASHYGVPFERICLTALLNAKVDDVVFAGRNLVLVSLAIAIAQARKFDRVIVGCNATDWDRFPDCRPSFWRLVNQCAETYGIKVLTPLIYMSKRDVVARARELNVPIHLTWSCYSPQEDNNPCGKCLACETRNSAIRLP